MQNAKSSFRRLAQFAFYIVAAINFAVAVSQEALAAPPGKYHVVHGWPVLPLGEVLGAAPGVGVDSKGNVFVFRRADRLSLPSGDFDMTPIPRPTVLVFNGRTGELVSKWGENLFPMPHGLYIDRQDNVWLTDVALHQIFKYSADGKLLMTIGERAVPGDDTNHFNRPTDVAVAEDGSIYVSDGYRNSRVVKFSPEGTFLFQWGTKGAGPGQFDVPHGIAIDDRGQLYVADRTNARVQVFDGKGKYLTEWKNEKLGRAYDVAIGKNGQAVVVDGGEQPKLPPDRAGAAVVNLDGTVQEQFGRFGNYDGQFMMAHAVAIGADGAIYVSDITGGRVQKFVREANE